MQKNKDRPIQKALVLDQLKPKKSRQGNPSAMSPGNPEPSASNRISRHSLSQACGNLPTAAREELAKRVNQSGSVRTIPTLDGRILLDWELYNIALDLGLPVRLEKFQGHDPVAFVVVHHLRHPRWDDGQRAVIAVRLHAWREPGRPEKPVHSTDLSPCLDGSVSTPAAPATTAEMAEAALVSPTFITRAKRVHELGLSEAVISGDLKFREAYRRVRLVLDAGLDDAVIHEEAEFDAACRRAQVVADAGLLKRVSSRDLDFDDAYRMALAGETGERGPVRPPTLTKAELATRVAELEGENQTLVQDLQRDDPEHSSTVVRYRQQLRSLQCDLAYAEARAVIAEAEANRLTALLRYSETPA